MLDYSPKMDAIGSSGGLLVQLLHWVRDQPRSYAETMDAWRTSCPRLSVWEDALGEGLLRVDAASAATQGSARVVLTSEGASILNRDKSAASAPRSDRA